MAFIVLLAFLSATFTPASGADAAGLGSLSGQVMLGTDGPAGSGDVVVKAWNGAFPVASTTTDESGNFMISGLASGYYKVEFDYTGAGGYADVWWTPEQGVYPPTASHSTARSVAVLDSPAVANMVLPLGGSVEGVTRTSAGQPLGNTYVTAYKYGPHSLDVFEVTVRADAEGRYAFHRLIPGDYQVRVYKESEYTQPFYTNAWYGSSLENPGGRVSLAVEPGVVAIADTVSFRPASVSGVVTCESCAPFDRIDSHFGLVRWDPDLDEWVNAYSNWLWYDGSYQAQNLYPGTYRAEASFGDPGKYFVSEPFVMGEATRLQMDIAIVGPRVSRLAGPDRFATAVAVSQNYEAGVPVLFVANGRNFPDALSAGPVAAHLGGPLLLVDSASVPTLVRDEIERLAPSRIVVVGGENAVSKAVFDQLSGLAGAIERIAGVDRYDTSRKIARYGFGESGAASAYVATGWNFPDAVSAGAAAAHRDAPVVLVNGAAASPDLPTTTLLADLGVESVFVLGGVNAVSSGMEAGIGAIPGIEVLRFAGEDRFDTSHQVNAHAFSSASTAFLAVGFNFPDALAGAAYAGSLDGPLFLAQPGCVSNKVLNDLQSMDVEDVVLLGGEATLSLAVEQLQVC